MGQRHQVYMFTNQGDFAWHNQWCYGSLPLRHLKRILAYEENTDYEYSSLTAKESYSINAKEALTHILCTAIEDGSIYRYSDITDEVKDTKGNLDFLMGDNNDGITVVDLHKKPFKYCFLLFPWEETDRESKYMRPLTAEQYALEYYKKIDDEWNNFGIPELVEYINSHAKLLTIDEVCKLFPTSMKSVARERSMIKRTKFKDLPILMDQCSYPVNDEYLKQRLTQPKRRKNGRKEKSIEEAISQ